MFTSPEQFAATTKALFEFQLETFNTLASKTVQGVEQVVALNMATAKSSLEDQLAAGKDLSLARDPKAVLAVAASKVQPGMTNAREYHQQLGGIITDIREEFNRAADAHMTEAKTTLSALIHDVTKNVRPGSDNAVQIVKTAIDNAFAGYEQVTTAARQAVTTVEAQIAKASAQVTDPQ